MFVLGFGFKRVVAPDAAAGVVGVRDCAGRSTGVGVGGRGG